MTENRFLKVAEVELVYKTSIKASERPKITCSRDAYQLLMDTWDQNKIELVEQFKVMLLNRAQIWEYMKFQPAGSTGTVADIRLIFAAALKANCVHIMLTHNHPSSNLQPSNADNQLTAKFKEAGKFLDIGVLDHLIVSKDEYYSYADEGLL